MSKKVILVPDIHGRKFWKDILPFVDECERIIFLGDYHDPYDYEGISCSDSIENFKEIIEFAKEHKDKVTLLLGNHDLSYYNRTGHDYWYVHANRTDVTNLNEIRDFFKENCDLFDLLTVVDMEDASRTFLVSHAGVHPLWVKSNNLVKDYNYTETTAEEVFKYIDNRFRVAYDIVSFSALLDIGFMRGGDSNAGSLVWADSHEFLEVKKAPYIQIFGHTQQLKVRQNENGEFEHVQGYPFITGNHVCIDCHKCFYIDEYGTICELSDNQVIL